MAEKEILLHYCWKHRLLPAPLLTADGREVTVVETGVHNDGAGPDFIGARVRIEGMLWDGDVEIHTRRRDWYAHGHDHDAAYDRVVLHVVRQFADNEDDNSPLAQTFSGAVPPEVAIPVPGHIERDYRALLSEDRYPPCYKRVPTIAPLTLHTWLAALQTERLEARTEAIDARLRAVGGDWEHAFFITLARSYGFGSNSDALEQWATQLPIKAAARHRDSIFQVEAIFFGAAGMLNIAATRAKMQIETAADGYFQRLRDEWEYLSQKFGIHALPVPQWKFMRMRPQNFPHIRIAQLARLYHERRATLSQLIACDTEEKLRDLLRCGVSPYWETHYTFGHESTVNAKRLSNASVTLVMLNCLAPMLFAYGRTGGSEILCQRAEELLDTLPPERNSITRLWSEVGLTARSAGEAQALIQLRREYCDRRRCLDCRIGYEYMK